MVIQAEQNRVKHILTTALPLLCKNGLSFSSEFCIEALIGITLDKNDVFLVNIKETIHTDHGTGSASKAVDISVSNVSPGASGSAKTQGRKRRLSGNAVRGDLDEERDGDVLEGQVTRKRKKKDSDSSAVDTLNFTDENRLDESLNVESLIQTESTNRAQHSDSSCSAPAEPPCHRTLDKESLPCAVTVKDEPVEEEDFSLAVSHTSDGRSFDAINDGVYGEQGTGYSDLDAPGTSTVDLNELPAGTTPYPVQMLPSVSDQLSGDQSQLANSSKGLFSQMLILPTQDGSRAMDYLIRSPDGPWICCVCRQISRRLDNAKKHVRVVHMKIKNCFCTYCGRGFSQSSNRKQHELKCAHKTAILGLAENAMGPTLGTDV